MGRGLELVQHIAVLLERLGAGVHVRGRFADLPEGSVLIELNDERAKDLFGEGRPKAMG
jgi:hypothetical protein